MDHKKRQSLIKLIQSDDNIVWLRKLLVKGLDPNLKYLHGDTLLHLALKSPQDNVKIVKALIYAGADTRSNSLLYKPLHIAVILRKRKCVEVLLKFKININSKDAFDRTALHYAVSNNLQIFVPFQDFLEDTQAPDLWIIRKLLGNKYINVDETDESLETPLMLAVKEKHLEIVKLLANHHSRLDSSNKDGQSALHMALTHKDPCLYIIVFLLLKRASLLTIDSFGTTPLNIILNCKSFYVSCVCLKVIAFNYNISEILINKVLKFPELSKFLRKCYYEISYMQRDFIAPELSIFNFFRKFAAGSVSGFHNPIMQVYKPVVERLITGLYPEYYCFILHRISKSNLSKVLKVTITERYCKNDCNIPDCKNEHRTAFSEVVRRGMLSDYLSSWDVFRLIIVFSKVRVHENMLNILEHDCYLTDSWEEYTDEYFYLNRD